MDFRLYDYLFFLASVLAALLLTLIPWPSLSVQYQPSWVLLILMFWCCVAPKAMNLFWFFAIGLYQDLMLATPLGLTALVYSMVGYVFCRLRVRVSQYPHWQQSLFVIAASVFQIVVNAVVMHSIGYPVAFWSAWPVLLLNGLLWRGVYAMMFSIWRKRLLVY